MAVVYKLACDNQALMRRAIGWFPFRNFGSVHLNFSDAFVQQTARETPPRTRY